MKIGYAQMATVTTVSVNGVSRLMDAKGWKVHVAGGVSRPAAPIPSAMISRRPISFPAVSRVPRSATKGVQCQSHADLVSPGPSMPWQPCQ